MHPTPELIHAQKKGHELPNQTNAVEYQLRTKSNALAATFSDQEMAQPFIDQRQAKFGAKAPVLELYRVTTITEKLS